MRDFAAYYRDVFDRFGYPLGKTHAIPPVELDRATKRLKVSLPDALREFYLVAGNERRFSRSLHRFLHPSKWIVDRKHITFLEENQSVCWWGVSVKSKGAKDPTVSQGLHHSDSIAWSKEHDRCSTFISVMLHYQAVSGGFRFCGSAAAPVDLRERLADDWQYAGEINQLCAASRQNQVLCVMPSGGLPFMPDTTLMAGAKTARDLQAIVEALSVDLT